MILVRSFRFVTTVSIVGLMAVCIERGASVLSFALANGSYGGANSLEKLQAYGHTPGVARFAHRDYVFAQGVDVAARIDALTELLALTPLESAAWQNLAVLRLASGEKLEAILGALSVSAMTGPNEAPVMLMRAVLGIRLWSFMPPELRRTIASDIIGSWSVAEESSKSNIRSGLALATMQSREELRALLLASGPKAQVISTALGLEATPRIEEKAGQ